MAQDFHILLEQHGKLVFRQATIGFVLGALVLLPNGLDIANLGDEPVPQPRQQDRDESVLLLDNEIDVIGFLGGGFFVLRAYRLKNTDVIARGEHPHQRREHAFNGISNVRGDYLGAAFLLIPERLPQVVVQTLCPLLREVAELPPECLPLVLAYRCLQQFDVHRSFPSLAQSQRCSARTKSFRSGIACLPGL